jgi:pimeloyl-ACP methyl ester carboxylesterase
MRYKLYLIDGTGDADTEHKYWPDMSRGFCMNLKQQNGARAEYLRGPTTSGRETWFIAETMLAFIRADRAKYPHMRVLLGGHSRGGSAAIYVARKLKEEKVTVHGMVLFDAVRRAIQKNAAQYAQQIVNNSHGVPILLAAQMTAAVIEAGMDFLGFRLFGNDAIDVIPSNVERAFHAVRDEKFSHYFLNTEEWKEIVRKGPSVPYDPRYNARRAELMQMHTAMRNACRFNVAAKGIPTGFSFGNTGLEAEPGCQLQIKKYLATHGAMGGAPLNPHDYIKNPFYAEQIEAQEVISMLAVQTRVNGFLKELGFGGDHSPVTLAYKPMSMPGVKTQLDIKK